MVTNDDMEDLTVAVEALEQKTMTVVDLLNTLLPPTIVDRLIRGDQSTVSERIDACTILMSDIVQFTKLTEIIGAHRVHDFLNILYVNVMYMYNYLKDRFDALCEKNGCRKLETVGDVGIMCVVMTTRHIWLCVVHLTTVLITWRT